MSHSHDIGGIQANIVAGFARQERNLETWYDVAKREIRIYDRDYGVELGALKDSSLRCASRNQLVSAIREACREPTSLEILYYAQVGGPHVRGAM